MSSHSLSPGLWRYHFQSCGGVTHAQVHVGCSRPRRPPFPALPSLLLAGMASRKPVAVEGEAAGRGRRVRVVGNVVESIRSRREGERVARVSLSHCRVVLSLKNRNWKLLR